MPVDVHHFQSVLLKIVLWLLRLLPNWQVFVVKIIVAHILYGAVCGQHTGQAIWSWTKWRVFLQTSVFSTLSLFLKFHFSVVSANLQIFNQRKSITDASFLLTPLHFVTGSCCLKKSHTWKYPVVSLKELISQKSCLIWKSCTLLIKKTKTLEKAHIWNHVSAPLNRRLSPSVRFV